MTKRSLIAFALALLIACAALHEGSSLAPALAPAPVVSGATLSVATPSASTPSAATPKVARAPVSLKSIEQELELGQVSWRRDYDLARAEAKKLGRPLFVLFDEVPG
ncbi:MAG: hypothetical protein JKY65_02495 [Planctomycetes bacterium]|nr:hypothetical protein [Planctomycetota bacterium]